MCRDPRFTSVRRLSVAGGSSMVVPSHAPGRGPCTYRGYIRATRRAPWGEMTMANDVTFGEVRNALKNEYDRVVNKVESEGTGFLEQPSYCSEWQVYQVVSHLGSGAEIFQRSLEAALDGEQALSNEGRQAIWDHFNALGPQDVYREARDRLDKLFAYLDALPAEKHNNIVPTFAGELPLPRALLTRLNEMALHSW